MHIAFTILLYMSSLLLVAVNQKPPLNMATTNPRFVYTINVDVIMQSQGFDSAAQIATEDEHNLGFREACRRYPTAIFWSIAISFTIVMEGYDNPLRNFYAYPQFNRKYGTCDADLHQWVISASFQAAILDVGLGGAMIGLLINGYVTERVGHRKVIMVSLVVMVESIFMPFFAPNLQVLVVGRAIGGILSGIFAIMGSAYASEECPLALRGFLTSFVNICWVVDQLIAAGILQGLVTNSTEWAYRIPFGVQWFWPAPLFLVALFTPDSPL